VTGQDVPGHYIGKILRDMPVLCWDRVRYVGDRVAAVAAETPEAAEEALQRIQVDYEELPALLSGQVSISLRTFVLMDSSLPGNDRYIAPGAPVFDPITAAAYLAGLVLSLRRVRDTLLWWCLFLPIVLVVHSLTIDIPDGARALPALPAMMLFAGLAIERAGRIWPTALTRDGLTLLVLVAAGWNWNHYVEWQRRPQNAAVRQPAVEVDEFSAWQQLEMAQVSSGQRAFTVDEWHRMRQR